jgi:hypothetical protein
VSNSTILDQLSRAVSIHPDWDRLAPYFAGGSCSRGIHLAVMVEPFLGYIMDGTKTIESRFSKNLIAPYRRISLGDLVFLKAGPVVGAFRASSVECVDLDDNERARLRENYSKEICADDAFWQDRDDRNYATLIGIEDVQPLTPVPVPKHDRRGWLVLRTPTSVGSEQLALM